MSSRHIRRLKALKENKEDVNEEQDTPDDEPYAQQSQTFQGLEVSSESEFENHALGDPSPSKSPTPGPSSGVLHQSANIPEEDKYGAKKKTYTQAELQKKEKMKQKKSKNKKQKVPQKDDDMDWLSKEMNFNLGTQPERVEETAVDLRELRKKQLFYINPHHLDVNKELAKVFGNKDKRSPLPRGRRPSHWIGVSPEIQAIKIRGIVMTRYHIEGDVKYFRFSHSRDYRAQCRELIKKVKDRLDGGQVYENLLYPITCLEACLENSDILYGMEEHSEGRLSVEQCLFCMQLVADPSFSYVDGNTRLLYDYVENRPFFIALLKYVYILSNTACYITALALGKVLLNLDKKDPLCVLFIIDTLAIRAREFKWLVNLVEAWRESRNANRFFNMRYSRALALFHIARRTKEGEAEADAALFKAIICYPTVVMDIIDMAKIPLADDLKNHELFNPPADCPAPCSDIQKLMKFYAWLIAPRWREPFISQWVMKVLRETTKRYDESSDLREKILENRTLVARLYRVLPTELKRHLYVIRSMSSYMGGGHMPSFEDTVAFNPFPSSGTAIDTYEYFNNRPQQHIPHRNAFMEFLGALSPNYDRFGLRRESRESNANTSHQINNFEFISSDDVMNISGLHFEHMLRNLEPNAGQQRPPPQIFECEEVDIKRKRVRVEDDDYFTEVFLSDDEKVLPMLTVKVIVIDFIVAIQMIYHIKAGKFIHDMRSAPGYKGYIEPPLD